MSATSPPRPRAPQRAPIWHSPPPRRPSRRQRARLIALITGGLCLLTGAVSWGRAIVQRSDSSLGVRTVEWIRDNGGRGLVNDVENLYYSLTAPSKGGPALRALPAQAGGLHVAVSHAVRAYRPAPIRPVIHPALPGEGIWHGTFGPGGSRPPVLITSFRPDPNYPGLVAGIAWIDHTRTSTVLYPGLSEPSVTLPSRGPMEVPSSMRSRLVATFNSGFKLVDSGGGVVLGGHTYAPLRNGYATIVRYADGRMDIVDWTAGPTAPTNVVYARQNLPLIVSGAKPNPNLSDGPEWGATLGNAIQVWRSAVGVDSHGNLIYAAANDQTVGSLAAIMIRAGAVRAMELDINVYWTSFITYRSPGAGGPANLLSNMDRSPSRYLTPDDRDFFAVYVR